jgi:hypothetical protein
MAFVRPPQLAASFIPELILKGYAFGVVFRKPLFRGICGGEDLGVIEVARVMNMLGRPRISNHCPQQGVSVIINFGPAMPSAALPGFVIHGAYDLVFKHDAFGIVHQKPFIGKVRVCKHLEMVTVADLLAGIYVNPDRFHWSLFSFRHPQ